MGRTQRVTKSYADGINWGCRSIVVRGGGVQVVMPLQNALTLCVPVRLLSAVRDHFGVCALCPITTLKSARNSYVEYMPWYMQGPP